MDPPGDPPGEPLEPRVITSPPPPENKPDFEAPPASVNPSLHNPSTHPPADRGRDSTLDHTGGSPGLWQHPPEQQQQQPQQQQQQAQESRDKPNANAVDDAGGSQPPPSGGTDPRAFGDDAGGTGDVVSKLDTILKAVHAVRQPLEGDIAAAALLSGMSLSLAECIDTLVEVQTDDALTAMFHKAGGGLRSQLEQNEARRQQAQQVDAKAAADRLEAYFVSAPAHLRSECEQMARTCCEHAEMLDMDPDPAVVMYAASLPVEHERAHPDGALARKLVLRATRRLSNSEEPLTEQHVINAWAIAVRDVRAASGAEPSARPGYQAQSSQSPSTRQSSLSQLYSRFSPLFVALPNRLAAPTVLPATPFRASSSGTPHHSTHAPPFPPLSRLGSSGVASPDQQLVQAQITSLMEGQTAAFEAIAASQQARSQLRTLAALPVPDWYGQKPSDPTRQQCMTSLSPRTPWNALYSEQSMRFSPFLNDVRQITALMPPEVTACCNGLIGLRQNDFATWLRVVPSFWEAIAITYIWSYHLVGVESLAIKDTATRVCDAVVAALTDAPRLATLVTHGRASRGGHEILVYIISAFHEYFIPADETLYERRLRDQEWEEGVSARDLFKSLMHMADDLPSNISDDDIIRDFIHVVNKLLSKVPADPSSPSPKYRIVLETKKHASAIYKAGMGCTTFSSLLEQSPECNCELPRLHQRQRVLTASTFPSMRDLQQELPAREEVLVGWDSVEESDLQDDALAYPTTTRSGGAGDSTADQSQAGAPPGSSNQLGVTRPINIIRGHADIAKMIETGLLPEIAATGHTGATVAEFLNPSRPDGLWGLECPFCVSLKSICDIEYSYNEYLDKFKCGPHRKKTPTTPEGARIMPPNECLCHQCTKCPTLWLHLERKSKSDARFVPLLSMLLPMAEVQKISRAAWDAADVDGSIHKGHRPQRRDRQKGKKK